MAKKVKRRANRSNHKTVKLSAKAREQKANEDLDAGRYRDAITGFKELLKQEPRPDWRKALGDAYAGRARELAAKEMLKEALVMWNNRASLGLDESMHPDHAALLMRIGEADLVLTLFADGDALASADREQLRPLLAAQAIAGNDRIESTLADDDPILRHLNAARTALTAYCSGDDETLKAALAEIPFRSPYRDWVQLLKALQQIADRPKEASATLARIGDDSAFAPLRRAAEMALLPDDAFLEAITKAGEQTLHFACAIRGWPPERISLHQELNQADAEKKPRVLLRLLQRHRTELGKDWVRRQVLRLLAADFPRRLDWLRAEGIDALKPEELYLVHAWAAEKEGDPWEQMDQWNRIAKHLIASAEANANDPLHPIRIATALRATEMNGNLLQKLNPSDDPEDLDRALAAQLEQSLEYDPDHRDTYLNLISYYRRGKRFKEVRRLLTAASLRWPKDMQILGAALDTALDTGAFKKAAGIARQMLDIDTINTSVRERLVDAHIAHGRKQVKQGRSDLARKELASAADWARGGHAQEQIDLISGLITLLEDDSKGASELSNTLARIGGGLTGRIALALAADGLGITQTKLQAQAKLTKPSCLGRDDLVAALSRLRTDIEHVGNKSKNLINWLDGAFSNVVWAQLERAEMEAACDTLRRYGLHKSRKSAAKTALKRWKGEPIFELHLFEASYPNGFEGPNRKPISVLENALSRAHQEGDTRTAIRIQQALEKAHPFGGFPPRGFPSPSSIFPDDPLDEDDIFDLLSGEMDDEMDELHHIEELIRLIGIERAAEMLGVPAEIRRELKRIKRQHGENAATQILLAFLAVNLSDFDDNDGNLPLPNKPRRNASRSGRGKPKRTKGSDHDNDDAPDHMSLF